MALGIVGRIRRRIDERLRGNEDELGRWSRFALRFARLTVLVERRFRADLCLERAASLAFSSVIAAIPAGMILLLTLQLFVRSELIGPTVPDPAGGGAGATVEETGGESGGEGTPASTGGATGESTAGAPGGGTADPAAEEPLDATSRLLEPVIEWVAEYVPEEENQERVRSALRSIEQELDMEARLRELIEQSTDQRIVVVSISILVLLLSAMTLLRSAERSFTGIWRVERRRSFFEKVATFWLLLTAAPLILGLSLYVKGALRATIESGLGAESSLAQFTNHLFLDRLFPLSISFFAFVLLMSYLPNTRVRTSAAAGGALTAAIGWDLGNRAFEMYVEHTMLSGVLGALGVIPFFLLWVYFSWGTVLVGAEVSYCLQHYPVLVAQSWGRRLERTVARPTLALIILERTYRSFRGEGPGLRADDLAGDLEVPIAEVEEVANVLVQADLLHDDAGGWRPGKAAERLAVSDVVALFPTRAGFRLPSALQGVESPLSELLSDVDRAMEERLSGRTLADLLADSNAPEA